MKALKNPITNVNMIMKMKPPQMIVPMAYGIHSKYSSELQLSSVVSHSLMILTYNLYNNS